MIDINRDDAPDIPNLSAKDLYLKVVKDGMMTTTHIEKLRSEQPDPGRHMLDFVGSAFFREHVMAMLAVMKRPGQLAELAHAAVLAEQRKTAAIAAVSGDVENAVDTVLGDVEAAAATI